jgi:hypothetical protein
LEFEVHWIAYQLQPLAPPEGVPKAVFMEQKFKGQAQYLMEKKQVMLQRFSKCAFPIAAYVPQARITGVSTMTRVLYPH